MPTLLVDPYSKDEFTDAIRTALDMPRDERVRRWQSLIESVRTEDVLAWRHAFVAALEATEYSPASTREVRHDRRS